MGNTIVPGPATDPPGGVSVGGVLYTGDCYTEIDFYNGDWNTKEAWLEWVEAFARFPTTNPNAVDGANIVCGINKAIYDMLPRVYKPRATSVLVSLVVGKPDVT